MLKTKLFAENSYMNLTLIVESERKEESKVVDFKDHYRVKTVQKAESDQLQAVRSE